MAVHTQIYQPYCHPYGNRRLVHCVPHQHDSDGSKEAAYSAEDDYFSSQKDAMTNHAHIGSGSKAVPHLQTAEGEDQDGVKVYITSWQGKKISWNDVEGEVPAWESCGKVIVAERQSYWRFVVSSLQIEPISGGLYLLTARYLDFQHADSDLEHCGIAHSRQQACGSSVSAAGSADWYRSWGISRY